MSKVILSGITPSGSAPHIGNYFGMIKPLIDLGKKSDQVFCFVADLHALTTVQDRSSLENNIKNVIISYLACGADAENFVLFRQSKISAHSELSVILSNYVGYGQMQRMHAFKDKLQKGADVGSINMGLFNYPILMSADILLYGADLVPVGADQKQHVEIARDIAQSFNRTYKQECLKLPEPLIDESVGRIIGIDGERKMSKSLNNTIDIFASYKVIEKQIMSAYTDPNRLKATDPGKVEGNTVFAYHDLLNEDKEEAAELKKRYQDGTVGDVEVKERLLEAHKKFFAKIRERKEYFESHPEEIERILQAGENKARKVAETNLAKVQKTVGLDANFVKKAKFPSPDEPRPEIGIEDFIKVEMRVGKVIKATEPEWSDKLIKQEVDFGKFGKRIIFSGLREWYSADDFEGKHLAYIINLAPRKMGEEESQGMIMAADGKDRPLIWEINEDVELGSIIG
ncbi:MAG: tryptophan--tRNA ligase [Pseudomonadales bacterium]|jgi:tryptophanyl-tRNA synthetase|nr:tryptophan--tRNA ligase [Pseudomonadales bacterium]